MTQAIPKEFTVRKATKSEIATILQEPRLMLALELSSEAELDSVAENSNFHIVIYENYKLLFIYKEVAKGIFEFHIACPSYSVVASRLLSHIALKWIYLKELPDIKYFVTNAPAGKIANFARKVGAIEFKRVEEVIHFVASPKNLGLI